MANSKGKKKEKGKLTKLRKKVLALLAIPTTLLVLLILVFTVYQNRAYPGVHINGVLVVYKNEDEIKQILQSQVLSAAQESIPLYVDDQLFLVSTAALELSYDLDQTARTALNQKRGSTFLHTLFLSPFNLATVNLPVVVKYNQQKLDELVLIVEDQIGTKAEEPAVFFENGQLTVSYGQYGKSLNKEELVAKIVGAFQNTASEIRTTTQNSGLVITQEQGQELLDRASKLIDKNITLVSERQEIVLDDVRILSLLSYPEFSAIGFEQIFSEVSKQINREPQNPVFVFENNRVTEFAPSKSGLVVDKTPFLEKLENSLSQLADSDSQAFDIPVIVKEPDYQTADVNNLGIKELLGVGSSTYRGSIASRVFNVGHASAKFKGILVAPGEEFSFNQTLGDVSALTGYKQAYIIQNGQTVLGDGGGVCQVSTTLFRAVLDAGLPIVERRSHSYRVTYYEQDAGPGLDATVFSPTTDFKFKNDTPGHLLIQAYADTQNVTLDFEIYGTGDGRKATLTKPVISSSTPPPEDLYIDDPTLPVGTVKQIDWKAWGAKVSFDYTVERNGEIIYQKTFYSNYQPWQAKFLRGTGPAI